MNEKKLKEEFIKWFGEDKWKEEEILSFIFMEEVFLCELMGIEPIPVIFDKVKEGNSYFNIDEEYIVLSPELIKEGSSEILESFLHELRHYYQICMVKKDSYKYSHFKYGIEHSNHSNYLDYILSPVEVDAFAFAQVMMEYVYDQPYRELSKEVQEIIDDYKSSHNLLDFYERSR